MDSKIVFHTSLKKRKELLWKVVKTDPSWKFRKFFIILLFCISFLMMAAMVVILIMNPTDPMGVFILLAGTLGLACAPYFLGLGLKNKSKYKCAYPYSSYTNGILSIEGQTLEYSFWQAGPTEPAAYSSPHAVYQEEDKFIYKIDRDNIKDLTINDIGICRIVGKGQFLPPEDLDEEMTKSEMHQMSNDFSFVLTFDEKNINDIILDWRNNKV